MIVALTLLCLVSETLKAEAKPRTAPIPEMAAVKLERNAYKAEIMKRNVERIEREFQQLNQENQALVAETCKAAGFAKCKIDPEGKLLIEETAETPKK